MPDVLQFFLQFLVSNLIEDVITYLVYLFKTLTIFYGYLSNDNYVISFLLPQLNAFPFLLQEEKKEPTPINICDIPKWGST